MMPRAYSYARRVHHCTDEALVVNCTWYINGETGIAGLPAYLNSYVLLRCIF